MTNKKNEKNKFRTGFTIIELLVVIVIIGILATISLVSYNGIQAKARDASVMSDLDTMDALQTNYGIKNGLAGKAYYSGSGTDATLGFTPSNGNVIDVVINSSDYCIRGYNVGGTKNTIYNAFIKESSVGVCAQISASTAALADYYGPPPSPSNLTAINNTSTQVTLNWSAPTNNGGSAITNYKVYRGSSSGNEVLVATISNVLTYVNSGLTASTTYYYKVTAVSNLGEGSYSNEVSAITIIIIVTGGNVATTDGAYTVRTFTSSGTLTVTGGTITGAQVLVIAAGGGGQNGPYGWGGGGGGGGYLEGAQDLTGSMSVTVGAGVLNGNGGNSAFGVRTAVGGGFGGNGYSAGVSGGSGGGGGTGSSGGAGTTGQGYAGHAGETTNWWSGGGGGAGGTPSTYKNGGPGLYSSISGTSVGYAGGGASNDAGGTASEGGGLRFVNGAANTGGGGGGMYGGTNSGTTGGSGIVIIRYLTP